MMRDAVTIVICLLFNSFAMRAQEWEWAKGFDAGAHDDCTSLGGTDKAGNFYFITNSRSYYNPPNPPPVWNFYKADRNGNIIWKKENVGGICKTDGEKYIYVAAGSTLIKYDTDGNVVWSIVEPYTYFQSLFLSDKKIIVNGFRKVDTIVGILAAYSLEGENLWLTIDKYGSLSAPMAVDAEGNSIVYSYNVFSTHPFDKKTLLKYNTDGNLRFTKPVPTYPMGIACTSGGESYLLGGYDNRYPIEFNGQTFIGSSTYTLSTMFLAKYTPEGELLWYKLFSGLFGSMEIVLNNKNEPYLLLETAFIKYDNLDLNANNGLCVFKLDAATGNIKGYVTSVGQIYHEEMGFPIQSHAAFNSDGDLLLAGGFTSRYTFGNNSLTCNDYGDIFIAKLSFQNPVSVKETVKQSKLFVHPNPSGSVFTVTGLLSDSNTFKITDVSGRCLQSGRCSGASSHTGFTVDLSYAPAGIYFLQLYSGNSSEVVKLVKN